MKFCEVSRNLISNRCWKFQLSILKNKKVFFLKKIFFKPYRQDRSKRWRLPSWFSVKVLGHTRSSWADRTTNKHTAFDNAVYGWRLGCSILWRNFWIHTSVNFRKIKSPTMGQSVQLWQELRELNKCFAKDDLTWNTG